MEADDTENVETIAWAHPCSPCVPCPNRVRWFCR